MDEIIEFQISTNKRMNLLAKPEQSGFCFTSGVQRLIQLIRENKLLEKDLKAVMAHAIDQVLSSFYDINQFYHFNDEAKYELEQVYQQLLEEIKQESPVNFYKLAINHYKRLQNWLLQIHPEAERLFSKEETHIKQPVVCAEYSAATQLQTLSIKVESLKAPILDIGCGKDHHLVNYLRSKGLDAYGIDRDANPSAYIYKSDWFDFDFYPGAWGTIISHLGFSNHFMHHHLKQNGLFEQYARTYISILRALKIGGSFYYAPGLPFIEPFLNKSEFTFICNPVPSTNLYAAHLTRMV